MGESKSGKNSKYSLNYLETKDDVKVLIEVIEPQFRLHCKMCHYGLELKGYITPLESGNIIEPDYIYALLQQNGIKGNISELNVEDFCRGVNQGRPQNGAILARGIYPVKGDDERVKFYIKPRSTMPHIHSHEIGEEESPIQVNTFFENVKAGDVVAEKVPAEEGLPGMAVNGEQIPPLNGTSLLHSPRPGKGVRYDKKCRQFFAEVSGCVVYSEGRGTISVEEKLVIADDVDFIVGHIDFVGSVEIHGDVMDELRVKAGKDIVVTGHTGECTLEAVGNITIEGMTGHEHGVIRCGGQLKARYLDGVCVECLGEILVANEIIDSNVNTAKALRCPSGRIIGGTVTSPLRSSGKSLRSALFFIKGSSVVITIFIL